MLNNWLLILALFIALSLGTCFGVLIMCIMKTAKRSDTMMQVAGKS